MYNNIKKTIVKPPRFGISNGWLIGEILEDVIDGDYNNINKQHIYVSS